MKESDLSDHPLARESAGNLPKGEVSGHEEDTQGSSGAGLLGMHEHPDLRGGRECLEKLSLAGIARAGRMEGRLVDRAGDNR
jgi:hypothetical protein